MVKDAAWVAGEGASLASPPEGSGGGVQLHVGAEEDPRADADGGAGGRREGAGAGGQTGGHPR